MRNNEWRSLATDSIAIDERTPTWGLLLFYENTLVSQEETNGTTMNKRQIIDALIRAVDELGDGSKSVTNGLEVRHVKTAELEATIHIGESGELEFLHLYTPAHAARVDEARKRSMAAFGTEC